LPVQVLQMILRESLTLVVLGVLVGIAISVGAMRWIANLLFGIPANDSLTYICVALPARGGDRRLPAPRTPCGEDRAHGGVAILSRRSVSFGFCLHREV
jgi:hypothetical protein